MSTATMSVQAIVDAVNASDPTEFVEMFDSEALLVDWGKRFYGAHGIERWQRQTSGGEPVRCTVLSSEKSADGAILKVNVESSTFVGDCTATVKLSAGCVVEFVITY